jgi:uncharacterized protein YutD
MIIETQHGLFELTKNYKEAFDILLFNEKYVDELFLQYTYIVGDVSGGKLRLKGFSTNPKSINSFKRIPDYLNEFCNPNAAFYILKKVKDSNKTQPNVVEVITDSDQES